MNHNRLINYTTLKKQLVALFSLVCIVGCSPKPSDINREYQNRLAHVLAISIKEYKPAPFPTFEKTTLPSPITISILELGQLDHCKLSQLIASHNNQLGKTAYPSELLKYQLAFVKQLTHCTETLSDEDNALKQTLLASFAQKQQALPAYFDNMVSAEREFLAQFRLTAAEFSSNDNQDVQQAFSALAYFTNLKQQLLTQTYEDIDESLITASLQALNNNTAIPAILSSSLRQINFNNSATAALQTLDLTSLCNNPEKAQIASNVFQKFFIKQLQPYQAALTSNLESLSPRLYFLLNEQPKLNFLFDSEHPNALLNQLKASAKQHVGWWQKFYQTCKINPYQ